MISIKQLALTSIRGLLTNTHVKGGSRNCCGGPLSPAADTSMLLTGVDFVEGAPGTDVDRGELGPSRKVEEFPSGGIFCANFESAFSVRTKEGSMIPVNVLFG